MNASSGKLYDLLMRIPIAGLTLFFLWRELESLRAAIGRHPTLDGDVPFLLGVAARVAVIEFLLLLALFFLARRPPVLKLGSLAPKVTAILGYSLTLLLLLLPRAQPNPWLDAASTALILVGNVACVLALLSLGRSLSILPEARQLVTDGPYRRIRHPLYLAEEVAMIGVFLQYRSWLAALLLIVHAVVQLMRIHWEEQVLTQAFPEYRAYCLSSHRLIPGIY